MKRLARSRLVIALVAMATMGLPGRARSASVATSPPLRSGTIVGGPDTMGSMPCGLVAECAAWLQSGCSPALAGRDPALQTSIVDVAKLADGTTRRVFEFSKTVLWSGVLIQFWNESCSQFGDCLGVDTNPALDDWLFGISDLLGCRRAEMRDAVHSYDFSWQNGQRGPLTYSHYTRLEIPRGARWMTVGGSSAVLVQWALSNAELERGW